MGMPSDPNRFPETIDLLNRAIESERGIAVSYPTMKEAWSARMRMFTKINDSRKQSKLLWDAEDSRWGRSPWDVVAITMVPPYDKTIAADTPAQLHLTLIDDAFYVSKNIGVEEL